MPITSRVFVKASLVYLGLGAVLGALLLINRWIPLGEAVASLRVVHVEFLVMGWVTQFIVGVAWWLFPPLAVSPGQAAAEPGRRGQAQRGSEPLFWATFAFLNAGILLHAVVGPLHNQAENAVLGFLVSLSGLFVLFAALTFVLNMWRRVRALGPGR
jgi:hypothetical protein